MTLTLLPRVHDLPPRWDGRTVEWGPWQQVRTSLPFHVPLDQQACTTCGLIDEPLTAGGKVLPLPGETFEWPDVRTLPSGRTYTRGTKRVPAWPVLCLVAFRCPGCGADRVHDERTGETWDLDASDYGDAGSVEVTGTLW